MIAVPTSRLTSHFTLVEMTHSDTAVRRGIGNSPPADAFAQLKLTCEMLEKIRHVLGDKPLIVTSGYRSAALNAAVGGVATSQHQLGQAADFLCPDFGTPREICEKLAPLMAELGIDQLIFEYSLWVHVSQSGHPRRQALTIDNSGTTVGIA